jgi:hypothetical protein
MDGCGAGMDDLRACSRRTGDSAKPPGIGVRREPNSAANRESAHFP